jgi:hypothetical protein
MPCNCEQCLQHYKTLGLLKRPSSKAAIHKAYRNSAKLWHPDHFENDPRLRPAAEEHFKLVQVAYRELTKHNSTQVETPFHSTSATAGAIPPISFDNAPNCFVGPYFPAHIDRIISDHMGSEDTALAIIDLSWHGSHSGSFSQFLLLTSHAVIVRDTRNIVAIVWYTDLGKINIVDQRSKDQQSPWKKLVAKILGTQQGYLLEISRRNGTLFYSLADEVDDSVKKVVYNFLLRKKHQIRP